nr:hypothetical protein [Streptomyces chrestomyceticus]
MPHDLGDVQGVVKDDRVREQGVALHRLHLLDRVVVRDDAAVAEADPLREAVECFGLVRRRGHPPAKRRITELAQQLDGADHAADLARRRRGLRRRFTVGCRVS